MNHPTAQPRRPFDWLPWRRRRFGNMLRPLPSSTRELTPDDWRIIRTALQLAVVHHTKQEAWPAAEAAQLTLAKVPTP